MWLRSPSDYAAWKAEMIREDGRLTGRHDAVVVLNFEKNGIENYVGGAMFLEMFEAFDLGKNCLCTILYQKICSKMKLLDCSLRFFMVI